MHAPTFNWTRTSSNREVAVCLAGAPRALQLTSHSLQANLLRPLKADLLAYIASRDAQRASHTKGAARHPGWRNSTVKSANIGCRSAVGSGAGMTIKEPTVIHGHIALGRLCSAQGLPEEGQAGRAAMCHLLSGATAIRTADDSALASLPADVWGAAAHYKGEWLHNSSLVQQYFGHWQCLQMIQEQESRRKKTYNRVVISRFDMMWLVPHPPLRLLDGMYVWVPHALHNNGINDRHAVLSRDHADMYLGSWPALLSGSASLVIGEATNTRAYKSQDVSPEAWNAIRLLGGGASVNLFPCTAYVACAEESLPSRSRKVCVPGRRYKYVWEYRVATRVVNCLKLNGTCPLASRAAPKGAVPRSLLWTRKAFDRCLPCQNERWLERNLCKLIEKLHGEALSYLSSNVWADAVAVLRKLSSSFRLMQVYFFVPSVAFCARAPVRQGGGCGGARSLWRTVLRWRRVHRLPRLTQAFGYFAHLLERGAKRSSLVASILALSQPQHVTTRYLCSRWSWALRTSKPPRTTHTSVLSRPDGSASAK